MPRSEILAMAIRVVQTGSELLDDEAARTRVCLVNAISLLTSILIFVNIPLFSLFDSANLNVILACAVLVSASALPMNQLGWHRAAGWTMNLGFSFVVYFMTGIVGPDALLWCGTFFYVALATISLGTHDRVGIVVCSMVTGGLGVLMILDVVPDLGRIEASEDHLQMLSVSAFVSNFVALIGAVVGVVYTGELLQQRHKQLGAELVQRTTELDTANAELQRRDEQWVGDQRELARFAAIIAHDLRGALGDVRGSSKKTFADHAVQPGSDNGSTGFKHVGEQVVDMQRFVEDLSLYARSVRAHFEIVDVNLEHVVVAVRKNLSSEIEASQGTIAYGTLPVFRSNPEALAIIIENLVGNALAHPQEGKQPQVSISCEQTEDHWVIRVADRGCGIGPKELDVIFYPFQRGARTRRPYHGLGLAVCKNIVGLLGGSIAAQSVVGEGSSFEVRLPRLPAAEKPSSADNVPAVSAESERLAG